MGPVIRSEPGNCAAARRTGPVRFGFGVNLFTPGDCGEAFAGLSPKLQRSEARVLYRRRCPHFPEGLFR